MKWIINTSRSRPAARKRVLATEAASEKDFTLRAFTVISVLFVVAWALTG